MIYLCLEGAVQVSEERMSVAELKNASFNERAVDVVVFKDDVFT